MNKFLPVFITVVTGLLTSSIVYGTGTIEALLSPDVPTNAIPADLKLPDAILPDLKGEFDDSIGKSGAGDVQYKIVMLATKITNVQSKKYDFMMYIVKFDVRSKQSATTTEFVSPDARVIAIKTIGTSSNSSYIPGLLDVVERDNDVNTRIAAAETLPSLGSPDMIVPKLVDLLRNQYGANRGKFVETDQKRYNDDLAAEAIIMSLGVIGDPRAFPVLLQTVMNPVTHLDDTVNAAWDAMKKIKW